MKRPSSFMSWVRLIYLQIFVHYLVPRQSVFVQLCHEWIWIEVFHVPNAWASPLSCAEHHRTDHGRNSCGVTYTLHAGLFESLLVATVVVYVVGECLAIFADTFDSTTDAGLSLVVLSQILRVRKNCLQEL